MCNVCISMCAWVDHVKVSCCMWVSNVLFVGDRNLAPVSDMSSLMLAQFKMNICWFKFFWKHWLRFIHSCIQEIFSRLSTSYGIAGTCSGAHAPWRQTVGRGEAVEHADVLRGQELHKLGIVKHLPLAVQDGCRLVWDVNNLTRDERHGYSKYILRAQFKNESVGCQYLSASSLIQLQLGDGPFGGSLFIVRWRSE